MNADRQTGIDTRESGPRLHDVVVSPLNTAMVEIGIVRDHATIRIVKPTASQHQPLEVIVIGLGGADVVVCLLIAIAMPDVVSHLLIASTLSRDLMMVASTG